MTKAEEIFNIKAEYNKWLKELTDDEKDACIYYIKNYNAIKEAKTKTKWQRKRM